MTRLRTSLLLVLGVVLLLLGVLPYVFFHPKCLNHDGFAAVQNGMTQQEVEHVFGGSPGLYYPTHSGAGTIQTLEKYNVAGAAETMMWADDERKYEILFDDEGRVVGKHERQGWHATAYRCRLSGWLFGRGEPAPLEPKKYLSLPPAK